MADNAHLVGERLARVMALDHLEREFEKVHDAMPELLTRIVQLEVWQRSHPDTHRLEGVALEVAKRATDQRLESMNELRKQIDQERGTFISRELYDREHLRMREELANLRTTQDAAITNLRTTQDATNATLRTSRDESAGEKGTLERFWPLLLSAGILAVAIVEAMQHWK